MMRTIEEISERVRRVCVKLTNSDRRTPATLPMALSVAVLVLGLVMIGLMVGISCGEFFHHYADLLTNLSHGS